MKRWNQCFTVLQRVEDGIMVILLSVMSVGAIAQVLNRNIFMQPVTWFEELARYAMVYMTLFAAEAGLRDGTQISIEAVVDKCHGRGKQLIQTFANLVLAVFAVIVFWFAMPLLQNQIRSGQLTPSLRIPMAIPYFAMCVGFGSIAATQCFGFVKKVVYMVQGKAFDEKGATA